MMADVDATGVRRRRTLRVLLAAGAAVLAGGVAVAVLAAGGAGSGAAPGAVDAPLWSAPTSAQPSAVPSADGSGTPSAPPSPSVRLVPSPTAPSPAGAPKPTAKAPSPAAPKPKLTVTSLTVTSHIDATTYTATVRVQLSGSGTGELHLTVYYPSNRAYESDIVLKKYQITGPGTIVKTITLPTKTVCAQYDPDNYQRGYYVDLNGQVLYPLQGSKDSKVECVKPAG